MIVFLTSSPSGPLDGSRKVPDLDHMNRFVDNLKKYWKEAAKCLMVAASPDAHEQNDEMICFFANVFAKAGLNVEAFDIWDDRRLIRTKEEVESYDVLILGGGHVPTQNRFLHEISLREKLVDFQGIIIGISAGTMNCAEEVYAQPEHPGEAADGNYQRFIPGLGLTRTQILPHYQMVKDWYLDGMKLYDEITYGDSWEKNFLVLTDGSYLLIEHGTETVWGEAYRIADGNIYKICATDERVIWHKEQEDMIYGIN